MKSGKLTIKSTIHIVMGMLKMVQIGKMNKNFDMNVAVTKLSLISHLDVQIQMTLHHVSAEKIVMIMANANMILHAQRMNHLIVLQCSLRLVKIREC